MGVKLIVGFFERGKDEYFFIFIFYLFKFLGANLSGKLISGIDKILLV
jgi:hypothetical protein